jgi:hypothetical protein
MVRQTQLNLGSSEWPRGDRRSLESRDVSRLLLFRYGFVSIRLFRVARRAFDQSANLIEIEASPARITAARRGLNVSRDCELVRPVAVRLGQTSRYEHSHVGERAQRRDFGNDKRLGPRPIATRHHGGVRQGHLRGTRLRWRRVRIENFMRSGAPTERVAVLVPVAGA